MKPRAKAEEKPKKVTIGKGKKGGKQQRGIATVSARR